MKNAYEMIDKASNLVEQMALANKMNDGPHFAKCHKEAGELLFNALRKMEDNGWEDDPKP